MALDLEQIRQILERPDKPSNIKRAINLQKRLRFHTEPNVVMTEISQAATEFLDWVKGLLPKDKFHTFAHLFKLPLGTPAVLGDAYRELERVFYGRNAHSDYTFTDNALKEDWLNYKRVALDLPSLWHKEGWKKVQTSPNSILVVDLPKEQVGLRPEPYFYWLEIDDVVDYKMRGYQIEWLVFRQGDDKVAVFDDTTIRVFETEGHRSLKIKSLLSESEHGLGYCPAQFYWTTCINECNKDIKSNPVVKELSNLDWYLFFSTSKQHLDLYAPYPIYSSYESDCNFENNETGEYCDGGFLRNADGNFKILADGTVAKCPCCSEKRIAGPGSYLEVPIPNQSEGIVDMRNPVQITSIDRDSLEYNVNECNRLRSAIISSIIGMGGSIQDREAINEVQVSANFESRTAALKALKDNFEKAQKFVEDTICRLRYGSDFLGSDINWGDEFYVFTISDLYEKMKNAKANGASEAELDAISDLIVEVEYRNNPIMLKRMLLLKQLEPFPHKTLKEALELYKEGLLSAKKLKLKVNFTSLIDRFERENTSIVEFGSNLDLDTKIDKITNRLYEYIAEDTDFYSGGSTAGEGGLEEPNKRGVGRPAEEPKSDKGLPA